ncbi:MAG: hypothetical protein ACKVY0_21990 [Prosthecobacter sp.]|uniref:hypothetical protein n=1 Tax=Prosthecobacter sp. TaxID=1965333 RepID=UPI003901026A
MIVVHSRVFAQSGEISSGVWRLSDHPAKLEFLENGVWRLDDGTTGTWSQNGPSISVELLNSYGELVRSSGTISGETLAIGKGIRISGNWQPVSVRFKSSNTPSQTNAPLPFIDLGLGSPASGSADRKEPVTLDRKGFVNETILDPEYRAQVEAESRAAQAAWVREEMAKDDAFKKLHDQKLKEWREKLPSGESNFDNHPDVRAIEALTGVGGVLLSPDELRRNDNALVDQGWFPYAKAGDYKFYRSNRIWYQRVVPILGLEEKLKFRFPDQKPELEIPEFRKMREKFLNDVPKVAPEEKK